MDAEEEKMKQLLASKFLLYKNLIFGAIEHPDLDTKITIEQAKRITAYAHDTYFRHLRLYDYVLKNTKYCEIKKVTLPKIEPKCGDGYLLSKAMKLNTAHFDTDDEGSVGTANKSDNGGFSDTKDRTDQADHVLNQDQQQDADGTREPEDSVDEDVKQANIASDEKAVIHKTVKQWKEKIDSAK